MPRRAAISLEQVAAWPNLINAFACASRGRTRSAPVQAFSAMLDANLRAIAHQITVEQAPYAEWRVFHVRDPKPRRITAPCFADRVMHHALMGLMGPVLDRGLVDDTFACRTGKGCLAAVHRVQRATRRWPWIVKADVKQYFASIDTTILMREVIERRIKGRAVLTLCRRILDAWPGRPGVGCPSGR